MRECRFSFLSFRAEVNLVSFCLSWPSFASLPLKLRVSPSGQVYPVLSRPSPSLAVSLSRSVCLFAGQCCWRLISHPTAIYLGSLSLFKRRFSWPLENQHLPSTERKTNWTDLSSVRTKTKRRTKKKRKRAV